jgi:glycosyltransferase involved in cell wall biosynthesis
VRSGAARASRAGARGIAQVLGSFSDGGAQRLAYNLAVAIGELGKRSYAVALRDAGHFAEHVPSGTTAVALQAHVGGRIGRLRAMRAFRAVVKRENIGVVHVHGTRSLPFVVLALWGLRPKVRLAFTWQDSENVLEKPGLGTRVLAWAIRRCEVVSGSSRDVARRLGANARVRNVGIFHGGVPVTALPDSRPAAPLGVLWIGRMIPPKDPQALIRATARLRDEGHRLDVHLVGSPTGHARDYFDQTCALIKDLGLADRVFAPGFVPDADMPAYFARAHIGVQTSHTEGMSIALMEQMMAGLAMVATDVGDTACAIRDAETGLLIPRQDDEALVNALRRIVTDEPLRRRLADGARRTAVETFSLEAMARRALRDYGVDIGGGE